MSAGGSGSGHEGGRSIKVRVKTGGRRTLSSKLWLERQLNDPYVARAKAEGMRSRAAYKLMELDDVISEYFAMKHRRSEVRSQDASISEVIRQDQEEAKVVA